MWQSMNSAPLDSTPVLLWHKDFVDEDFNPSGVIDGYFSADADCGWIGAIWNGCQDCWDTIEWLEPSHWMPKINPNDYIKSKPFGYYRGRNYEWLKNITTGDNLE